MSSFSGVLGGDQEDGGGLVRTMLRAMPARGDADRAGVWSSTAAALGVSRLEWELGDDYSGSVHVLAESGLVLAADATLCYRDDLRRRLALHGVTPTGDTSSHLILAAYRAWGTECPRALEGEFAFVLWDVARGQALCSRDFLGRRPFFYADIGGSLVTASTIGAILAHPGCDRELNLVNLAATAAGLLWSAGSDTAYRAIQVLPAAGTLVWSGGPVRQPTRHWTTPEGSDAGSPLDSAAEELRELLRCSVAERLASRGTTTVWMSGGWDSTTVFGAGKALLRDEPGGRSLLPVSISYPEGDPGREDELIASVAAFWDSPVHWLDIDRIPLLESLDARAAAADEPPLHLYEPWNRALARGSRAGDSRVALDGCGGDHLFQVSDIYLADLLRRGSLGRLSRELRGKRRHGVPYLLRYAVEPLLPPGVSRLTRAMMGWSTRGHYLERPLPAWVRSDFAARHRLAERDRSFLLPGNARSLADAENRCYLTAPMFAAGASYMSGALLEEGIEARSPLLDRRIVEFALRRPVEERAAGAETKLLLRRAATGLLPPAVLAPRTRRTGVTSGYSSREMRRHYPALFGEVFESPLLLAEFGIVEPQVLRQSVDDYLSRGGDYLRVALFHALKTEMWLRAHLGAVPGAESPAARPVAARPVPLVVRGAPTPPRHAVAVCAGQSPVLR
jgi:asparagine synthase (glutamine-hydrolysing)